MTSEQAIKFCERLAKDPEFNKQYANDGEFDMQDIISMLKEYDYMKDDYYKYEYVCDRMSSDEYCELCSMYEAECKDDECEDEEEDDDE